MLKLTIKNYRCFSDQHPARLEYGHGFTALVGPNNAGKSAFLRFIHEHQALWGNLQSAPNISALANNSNDMNLPLRGVVDPAEVICDYTKRPLAFDATWSAGPGIAHLKSLSLTTRDQV